MIDLGLDYSEEPDWKVRIVPIGNGEWEYELDTEHTFSIPTVTNGGVQAWTVKEISEWSAILYIPRSDLQGYEHKAIRARRRAEDIILRVKRHWENLQRSPMTVDAGLLTHWDGDPSQ